jgi:hypothetical protein
MRWQRAALVFGANALLQGAYVAGCVDGVTPDCSDAATQCGPNIDGAADRTEAAPLPEAQPPADSATDVDARSDAGLDAGDAG